MTFLLMHVEILMSIKEIKTLANTVQTAMKMTEIDWNMETRSLAQFKVIQILVHIPFKGTPK